MDDKMQIYIIIRSNEDGESISEVHSDKIRTVWFMNEKDKTDCSYRIEEHSVIFPLGLVR